MLNKLLNCPCCGSSAEYEEYGRSDGQFIYMVGRVSCLNKECRIQTPPITVDGFYGATTTKEDAIRIWNRRI